MPDDDKFNSFLGGSTSKETAQTMQIFFLNLNLSMLHSFVTSVIKCFAVHLLPLTSTPLIHLNKEKDQLPIVIQINDLQEQNKRTHPESFPLFE